MKTTYLKAGKTLALVTAGKLAVGAGSSMAVETDLKASLGSKLQMEDNAAPPLSLNQIGYPLDLLTPPTEGLVDIAAPADNTGSTMPPLSDRCDTNADGTVDEVETNQCQANYPPLSPTDPAATRRVTSNALPGLLVQSRPNGIIWTGVIPAKDPATGAFPHGTAHPRIDFIIGNIRNDNPVDVYLAYSTKPGQVPFKLRSGSFSLDYDSLRIVAGSTLQPEMRIPMPPTPLGRTASPKTRSVVISIALDDLNDPTLAVSNELFFQALVLPQGAGFDEGQASEVDRYVIQRVQAGVTGSGSKGGADGSKLTDDVDPDGNGTGSKTEGGGKTEFGLSTTDTTGSKTGTSTSTTGTTGTTNTTGSKR